mgnify:CR=1 FL=1
MHDPTGDRMKDYERAGSGDAFDPSLPVYARIDGRGFSRFTRGMRRPFDARMTRAMAATAETLLLETQCRAAYVQSDEISLVWHCPEPGSELFFGGKPQKMVSVLAGLATAAFTKALIEDEDGLAEFLPRMPHFDARACQMPSTAEAAAMFAWRGSDARRNAIQSLARSHFSHRSLQGVSTSQMLDMLSEKGIRLDAEPNGAVNGKLLTRSKARRALTEEERAVIPAAHRPAPGAQVLRTVVNCFEAAPLWRLENLEDVLFEGCAPRMTAPVAA